MLTRGLCFVIGFGLLALAGSMGGGFTIFLDAPSLLIVVLGGFIFAAMGHGPVALGGALLDGMVGESGSPSQSQASAMTLQTLRVTIRGCGLAGVLIGSVQMLANLDDPSAIGPAVAVALLTPLYAVILAELFIAPLHSNLLRRGLEEGSHPHLR